jgi:hypothetical protein
LRRSVGRRGETLRRDANPHRRSVIGGGAHIETIWPRHALFDPRHRFAGHSGKGLNFFLQGERIGRVLAMLQGVAVSLRSAATRPVHPSDERG